MRNYVALAEDYVDAVLSGRRPAGRLERLACERHRRDIERAAAEGAPFYFDAYSANHVCRFVERCPHTKGEWARRKEKLVLEGWQVFVLASAFGWRRTDTNARRYTTVYIEVPRKNGKSALVSPLLPYMAVLDGEEGAECYSAATKKTQARIVFDTARLMVLRMPKFTRRHKLRIEAHKIGLHKSETVIRPLEAKTLDGLNVHFAIIDELHEHPNAEVYDALDQGRSARAQPMLLMITTAGADMQGICRQQHDYLEKLLAGHHQDDSYFGVIYAVDPGDDPFDPTTWEKANPNLGVSKKRQAMENAARRAQASPKRLGTFLRKDLGIWTSIGATAFSVEDWKAGADPSLDRADFKGAGGVLALDLALRNDFIAITWQFYDEDGSLVVFAKHFCSEATARADGNEHVAAWVAAGLIEMHDGALMDLDRVEEVLREWADHFGAEEISYDPHLAAQMAARMSADGYAMVEFRQTPMNMHPPFQQLQGLVEERRVRTDGDPVLEWQAGNAIIVERGDFEKLTKAQRNKKIDAISSIVTGLGVMQAPEETEEVSVYEQRGLLFV